MTTISANSTIGIDLNPASYTSPVVIGAGVTISNPSYPNGVYRDPSSTVFFTVKNEGTVTASDVGVYLAPGGWVTNATSALITSNTGIKISGGAGTVVNNGSIVGAEVNLYNGNVTGSGVYLLSGGSVTNASTASITGGGY